MSLLGPADVGDWVVTTRVIKTTMTDHLLGGDAGIEPGTRGVVTGRSGWSGLEVELDAGLGGAVHARVHAREVRVTRRGGGVDAFSHHASRVNAARAGVALALIAPFLYFAASWFLHGGSKDGLVVALLEGAVYGALDLVAYALSNPVQAGLYLLALWAAGRFAFGR